MAGTWKSKIGNQQSAERTKALAIRRSRRQRDSGAHGETLRTTLNTVLVGVLGVIIAAATASSDSPLNRSPVTWAIIAWTLAGMAVVGLWPTIGDFVRVRPRGYVLTVVAVVAVATSLVMATLLSGAGARPRTDTSQWKPDGTDPIAAGCRKLNGQSIAADSVELPRGKGGLGSFVISYNTYAKCGIIWAEFYTPRTADGKRAPFRDAGIAEVRLELVRAAPHHKQWAVWNYETANEEGKTDQDLWTDAINLAPGGEFQATATIRFADNTTLTDRLTASLPAATVGTRDS